MTKKTSNLEKKKTGFRAIDISVLEKMRQPSYHHINRGLIWNATPTDKTKYEICQSILGYKQENNLSRKEIGEKLGIKSIKRLECLLYCHINNFSLDELGEYLIKLSGSFELKIIHSVTQSKSDGRRKRL